LPDQLRPDICNRNIPIVFLEGLGIGEKGKRTQKPQNQIYFQYFYNLPQGQSSSPIRKLSIHLL
jgi:hypothetical protein